MTGGGKGVSGGSLEGEPGGVVLWARSSFGVLGSSLMNGVCGLGVVEGDLDGGKATLVGVNGLASVAPLPASSASS